MGQVTSHALNFGVVVLVIATLLYALPPGIAPVTAASPISNSMTPTITQGEVVVVVDEEPEVGDIVLFSASSRRNPVLHRIVDTTADGAYITQGDANDVTDQRDGLDPVTDDQIHGVVVTSETGPITVPVIGAILTNPAALFGLWFLLAIVGFGPAVGRAVGASGSRLGDAAENTPGRGLVIAVALLLMIAVPIAVMGSATTEQVSIISSMGVDEGESSERVVAVGETTERTVVMSGGTLVGMTQTAHIDGGLRLEEVKSGPFNTSTTVSVSNPPRDKPGATSGEITLYTYPATLPHDVLMDLAAIHPAVAGVASASVISGVLIAFALLFIHPQRRVRSDRRTLRAVRRRRNR